jgi:hypothetical protein
MRRRALLAGFGTAFLPLAGCTSDGDGGSTSTDSPTASPTPTSTASPTPSATPPPDAVAVETPAPGECAAEDPPWPTTNPLATPRDYPDRPADLTPETVRSYLTAYEAAFVENLLLTDVDAAPEGLYPVDPDVDAVVEAFRHGDGWFLAGLSSSGGMGYDHPDPTATTEPPANVTFSRTPTRTAVPGITVSRVASYLVTERFLLRQDHGWDGDAPAAVDGGTVYACF